MIFLTRDLANHHLSKIRSNYRMNWVRVRQKKERNFFQSGKMAFEETYELPADRYLSLPFAREKEVISSEK